MRHNLLFILLTIIVFAGCMEESTIPVESFDIDNTAKILSYIESTGDYPNSETAPAIVTSLDVYSSPQQFIVIDVRNNEEFKAGHIPNAQNVQPEKLYSYIKSLGSSSYTKRIVLVSKNGQSSAYYTCLLRMAGFNFVYTLNYGMASWHEDFADEWFAALGLHESISAFSNKNYPKGSMSDLPAITLEIKGSLEESVNERISSIIAKGFNPGVNYLTELPLPQESPSYVVCYGSLRLYAGGTFDVYGSNGHMEGTTHYILSDLQSNKFLQTLPADREIIIYSGNGQSAACITAYLTLLGYNVKSLLFGANHLFYERILYTQDLSVEAFSSNVIANYPYVTDN